MNLNDILIKFNRKRVPVLGDGNCQFYSILKSMFPDCCMDRVFKMQAEKIRKAVGIYMWSERRRLDEFFIPTRACGNFKVFCKKITSNDTSVLGDNFTLFALSEIYNVPIRVFQFDGTIVTINGWNSKKSPSGKTVLKVTRNTPLSVLGDSSGGSGGSEDTIEICYTGSHYDAVVRK